MPGGATSQIPFFCGGCPLEVSTDFPNSKPKILRRASNFSQGAAPWVGGHHPTSMFHCVSVSRTVGIHVPLPPRLAATGPRYICKGTSSCHAYAPSSLRTHSRQRSREDLLTTMVACHQNLKVWGLNFIFSLHNKLMSADAGGLLTVTFTGAWPSALGLALARVLVTFKDAWRVVCL